MSAARIGVVVIGRNEGERLRASLGSLAGRPHIAYVDSGSIDGSQDLARDRGVTLIELPVPPKFTAARARNAGMHALLKQAPALDFIQFVDGDCVVEPGWIDAAAAALEADPGMAGVFGRRREIAPGASLYNRLCDIEWDVPVGPTRATGGDAMFRVAALGEVGGYDPALIAGEEPDMCLRMGQRGWRFARIDAAMTRHDAHILRLGQWWRRANRAGYAAASHVARHGPASLPGDLAQVRRMILWALALPLAIAALALLGLASRWFVPAAFLLLLVYPLQWRRLARAERRRLPATLAWQAGGLRLLHQFAAMSGLVDYARDRLSGQARGIIEYK